MTENQEFLKQLSYQSLSMSSPEDALRQYALLDEKTKRGMATCYKEFEKWPWFDDPYDPEQLVNVDFPSMVRSFTPGGLVIAKNTEGEVVGFASGGRTNVVDLVNKKYDGNTAVAQSIMNGAGLTETDEFMYENEMVVVGSDEYRNKGLGTKLSNDRLALFQQFGYGAVLGRSLNEYLLKMKKTIFSPENGFSLTTFIPNGDPYVNPQTGTKRTIYFATKMR